MIRALIWKEYRELRWTLFGYVSMVFLFKLGLNLLQYERIESGTGSYWSNSVLLMFSVPLFALFIGASTFAHEEGNKTLAFLLTKPISRSSLFILKTLVSLAFMIVGVTLISFAMNDQFGLGWDQMTGFVIAHHLDKCAYVLLLSFGMGILGSQFSKGSVIASVVGGVIGLISLFLSVYLDALEPIRFVLLILVVGSIAIAAATVPGREVPNLTTKIKRAGRAGAILLAVLYASLHCWNAWMSSQTGSYIFRDFVESPKGVTIVAYNNQRDTSRYRTFVKHGDVLARWENRDNVVVHSYSPKDGNTLALDHTSHWGTRRTVGAIPNLYNNKGEKICSGPKGRFFDAAWSQSGKKVAVEIRYHEHFFGKQHFKTLVGDTVKKQFHLVSNPLPDYYFELLGWKDEEHLLGMCDSRGKDKDEENTIIEINLEGKETARYKPFQEKDKPYLVGRMKNGSFLFRVKEDDDKRKYVSWAPNSKLKTLSTIDTDWYVSAISDCGRWLQIVSRDVEDIETKGRRKAFEEMIRRWKVEKKVAIVDLSKIDPNIVFTPKEETIVAKESFDWSYNSYESLTSFWSRHHQGFLFVIGTTPKKRKLVCLNPKTNVVKTIINEKDLVLP